MIESTEIQEAIESVEKTLVSNVAHAIIMYEFFSGSTQEEIEEFFGGRGISKESQVESAQGMLRDAQVMLEFIRKNRNKLNKEYGNKDATTSFDKIAKRPNGDFDGQESEHKDVGTEKPGGGVLKETRDGPGDLSSKRKGRKGKR